MKRCARCQAAILSSELVMRARDLVFHVHCFTCAVCNSPLTKGDHFGMKNGAVFCRLHYEIALTEHTHPMGPTPPASKQATFPGGGGGTYLPPYPSPEFHPHHPHHHHHHHHHHPLSSPLPIQTPTPAGSEGIPPTSKVSYFNGAPTGTTRQKGRPRKRKPKDLEAMTASLDQILSCPLRRGGARRVRHVIHSPAALVLPVFLPPALSRTLVVCGLDRHVHPVRTRLTDRQNSTSREAI
uniref:LIM zinc-binding domain-containing protein n=1 Tax=Timema genevievae TaxID=629358 RepID=A0A7R9K810_TIMGE|nr:unnamed protein product [Timema genevievae]